MYADPSARAGVLEPAGLVEIKFKKPDLLALMQRLDPEIAALRARGGPGTDGEIAVRQKLLLPMYHQVRLKLMRGACLPDLAGRFQSKRFQVFSLQAIS